MTTFLFQDFFIIGEKNTFLIKHNKIENENESEWFAGNICYANSKLKDEDFESKTEDCRHKTVVYNLTNIAER